MQYFNTKIDSLNPDDDECEKQLTKEQWKVLAGMVGVQVSNRLNNKSKVIRAIQQKVVKIQLSKAKLNAMMKNYDNECDEEQRKMNDQLNNNNDSNISSDATLTDEDEDNLILHSDVKDSNDKKYKSVLKKDGNNKNDSVKRRVTFADDIKSNGNAQNHVNNNNGNAYNNNGDAYNNNNGNA